MCLILFAFKAHPDYSLILAANRDEFHARPSAPAQVWDNDADIVAGRDLEQGGTWMGITRSGRFAAITNFRGGNRRSEAPSRGALVTGYLRSTSGPLQYLENLADEASRYNGFSLLAGDLDELWFFSNHGEAPQAVEPGIHGLSNHLLDTPWPKVERGKTGLERVLRSPDDEALTALLADAVSAEDSGLPDTGVGLDKERWLSSIFVHGEQYGTRCSSALLIDRERNVTFVEHSFDASGESCGAARLAFRIGT